MSRNGRPTDANPDNRPSRTGETEVTPRLRAAVELIRAELGPHRITIAEGWSAVAARLGVEEVLGERGAAGIEAMLFVGDFDPADLDRVERDWAKAVRDPEVRVGLVAFEASDPTTRLWRHGWSPITVHRVPDELIVIVARPTPARPTSEPG